MRKKRNVFFWLVMTTALLPAFNNCSGNFSTEKLDAFYMSSMSFSSLNISGECESQLFTTFQGTYRPFLQTNCGNCHIPGGGGSGNFASNDPVTAFNEFMLKGTSRIDGNAVGSHKPPYTGPQHTATISGLNSSWGAGMTAYNQCVAARDAIPGAGGGPGDVIIPIDPGTTPTADTVITSNKRGPAGYISNSPAVPVAGGAVNYTNYNGWRTIEWSLNLDVVSPSRQNLGFIAIDVAPFVAIEGGVQVKKGFIFRNPRARLAAAGNPALRFQKIYIRLNNQLVGAVTTYSNVDSTISSTTATQFIPGTTYGLLSTTNPPSDADDISLQVQMLTTGAAGGGGGAVVPTFAQLTGNDATLNVFQTSCVSCHNNANPRGNLNLQNYASAMSKGALIVSRMKNANDPMPTGGLLPAARVQLVESWVNANYPQ